jgi:hypothetical protein
MLKSNQFSQLSGQRRPLLDHRRSRSEYICLLFGQAGDRLEKFLGKFLFRFDFLLNHLYRLTISVPNRPVGWASARITIDHVGNTP